ncbi:uncharacterized protein MONOS_17106 [Monocercomonoides exilis]|uniref:uncharacterized protein n=1 Tax=Monocercomonoides exilis TaxID=2049356 RepID=UPI00355A83D2|nr:hypothetical protein MONOS_17106 [Monocercomonoides exilis]
MVKMKNNNLLAHPRKSLYSAQILVFMAAVTTLSASSYSKLTPKHAIASSTAATATAEIPAEALTSS